MKNLSLMKINFLKILHKTLNESIPRPKYVVVNFPHNPTTVTCKKSFYERLIATAKKKDFILFQILLMQI